MSSDAYVANLVPNSLSAVKRSNNAAVRFWKDLHGNVVNGGVGQFRNGIHLDFRKDYKRGHYVKIPGKKPTIAAFNTLFTFTGDNKSMYRGASGLLVPSATNTPRIEYDAVGNVLGLLVEGARTNSLIRSTLVGGGAAPTGWTQPTGTGSSAPATSTLGTDQVAYLQSAAAERPYLSGTAVTLSTSTVYCFSLFVESVTGTVAVHQALHYDTLLTGASVSYPACEANPGGGSGGPITTGRLHFLYTVAGTGGSVAMRAGLGGSGAATGSLQFSRPQIEAGSFPSSYIPTTTASVGRAADVPSRTFGADYSASAGTVFAEYDLIGTPASTVYVLALAASGRHIYHASGLTPATYDGTTATNAPAAIYAANVMVKVASTYGSAGNAITINGASPSTASFDGAWGTGETSLGLGHLSGSSQMFGHIRRLSYFPERKSNTFLQWITR